MSRLAAVPLRLGRIRAAHRLLGARLDARREAGDPRLHPVHRRRRRLALAKGPGFHPALSADQWLTLVFGLVDLASTSPFMLKYEAVITNAATGLAFVAGALGEKPLIQEVAEQRGETFVATQEVRGFFRLFTLVWAAYFFSKRRSTAGRPGRCRCSRRWR